MLSVIPVSAFKDNYIWVLHHGRKAVVVDPGDAGPVLRYLAAERLELAGILATHHHADHVGGVARLLEDWTVPVYGPRDEPIATVTHPVTGGDRIAIPALGVQFDVLDIPGHTRAHIAYYGAKALFCGDTLFACGCGRVFEGTPAQLYASLRTIAALPDETLVYCGHEYTLANIAFARTVDAGNTELAARESIETAVRSRGQATLPSTLGREKRTNPFLRCTDPAVIRAADQHRGSHHSDPVEVFTTLRAWKNGFQA